MCVRREEGALAPIKFRGRKMRKLVLWGHHVDDYQEMFDLSKEDLESRLLEYGCGPSALNAELHETTQHVVSCDALFNLDKATLSMKTSLIFAEMVARVIKDQEKFAFSHCGGLERLIARRQQGMKTFFADYERGCGEKRYLPVSHYQLPFADFSFDFALSSHYLFAGLDGQDVEFHLQVIQELARVAKEVRIFPLIDRFGETSSYLGPILLGLQQANYGVEVRKISYHLQPAGNAMLRVWAQECQLG